MDKNKEKIQYMKKCIINAKQIIRGDNEIHQTSHEEWSRDVVSIAVALFSKGE